MKSTRIAEIKGRELLDSRGHPTVEAEVVLECGARACALVPSGASRGEEEAWELRDGDKTRFRGLGVSRAVHHIRSILAPALQGQDALDQLEVDRKLCALDGTPNKSKLGANALLAVSLACAKAAAQAVGLPLYRYVGGSQARILPVPFANLVNGGVHSEAPLDFQEFMIVPRGFPTFSEALRSGVEIVYALREVLQERHLSVGIGDEGGFAPELHHAEEVLELMTLAVKRAGYAPGREIFFAIDVAASQLYEKETGLYTFPKSGARSLSIRELVGYYQTLAQRFPLVSLEDGAAEEDWEGWKLLTETLGKTLQLVGDDLFVTQVARLQKGVSLGVANAILIKLNQVGTLSEAIATATLAQQHGYRVMLSHRSGETEDPSLADFAVAIGAGQIKTGSFCRSERVAKYNQLLRIEEALGPNAVYAGALSL
ncbi:phosphopyruvate hydratase [Candidatus Methylacidithermus pantelleriae]|uniref:Enolase n=1 Tax=Candidatus Methylacidithermus pantelleriae TaxID=2744239 RepID=A0A8J2BQ19_9BACT|nr:phosphopyruvate hydratase [Candidatus Methylacidithermus pantelleriae]CAF0689205.1 Enolase [Candidatus Methylacidithermus pantelleriae]